MDQSLLVWGTIFEYYLVSFLLWHSLYLQVELNKFITNTKSARFDSLEADTTIDSPRAGSDYKRSVLIRVVCYCVTFAVGHIVIALALLSQSQICKPASTPVSR